MLLQNWRLKLLAFAISISLWATYTAEPFADVGFTVPVAFINLPAGVTVAGDVPNTVRVRLRGRPALLRRVDPADLRVTIDMAKAGDGEVPVRLTPEMVEAPDGTDVILVTPSQFRVKLMASSTPPGGPA
jgi:hypothetical protein